MMALRCLTKHLPFQAAGTLAARGPSAASRTIRQIPLYPSLQHSVRLASSLSNKARNTSANMYTATTNYANFFLGWYAMMLSERPILTKAVTSGVIAGTGDILCQYIVRVRHLRRALKEEGVIESGWQLTAVTTAKNDDSPGSAYFAWWDYQRTGRFVVLGSVLVAPIIHVWFNVLAKTWPSTSASSIFRRVAVDQFVFTPIYIPMWLTAYWTLEDRKTLTSGDGHHLKDRLMDVTPSLLWANWAFWIPAQYVNFTFVALPYQVLFSNVVALLWTAYSSFLVHAEAKGAPRVEEAKLHELPIV